MRKTFCQIIDNQALNCSSLINQRCPGSPHGDERFSTSTHPLNIVRHPLAALLCASKKSHNPSPKGY